MRRLRLRNDDELEQAARIPRTVVRAPTLNDIKVLERKKLGPSWGKKRRKYEGP